MADKICDKCRGTGHVGVESKLDNGTPNIDIFHCKVCKGTGLLPDEFRDRYNDWLCESNVEIDGIDYVPVDDLQELIVLIRQDQTKKDCETGIKTHLHECEICPKVIVVKEKTE